MKLFSILLTNIWLMSLILPSMVVAQTSDKRLDRDTEVVAELLDTYLKKSSDGKKVYRESNRETSGFYVPNFGLVFVMPEASNMTFHSFKLNEWNDNWNEQPLDISIEKFEHNMENWGERLEVLGEKLDRMFNQSKRLDSLSNQLHEIDVDSEHFSIEITDEGTFINGEKIEPKNIEQNANTRGLKLQKDSTHTYLYNGNDTIKIKRIIVNDIKQERSEKRSDYYENKLKEALLLYGDLPADLSNDKHILLLLPLANMNNRAIILKAKMQDLRDFRAEKISREEMLERITTESTDQDTPFSFEVMAEVLDKIAIQMQNDVSGRNDQDRISTLFGPSTNKVRTNFVPNLGVLYTLQIETLNKPTLESGEAFEKQLKEAMITYGITLNELDKDLNLLVCANVKSALTTRNAAGPDIKDKKTHSLFVVSKKTLDAYRAQKISLAQAVEQIQIY